MAKGDSIITESAEVKIARIEVLVEETHARLFGGDGQKGVIEVHSEAISVLKAWRNKVLGALSVISCVLGIIGTKLVGWW